LEGTSGGLDVILPTGATVAQVSSGYYTVAALIADATANLSADINADGVVNGADLGVLLSTWGPAATGSPTDLNGDGVVNGRDLGKLIEAWTD
jgi:hypothetical protein